MFLTETEIKNLTKEFRLGKYAQWINEIEKKENNKNKSLRAQWKSWIESNVYPNDYTHFFTLTLRDNRNNSNNEYFGKPYGDSFYIRPGVQRYRKAVTKFENLLRRAPVTHYALITEEGDNKGQRDFNLHCHGDLRYTGDWESPHPAFMRPFDEWAIQQGKYRLEIIKTKGSTKYLTKYLTKENNLWHFGLFNAKKESDMRKEFKRKYEKLGMGVDHIKSNVNEVQLEFEGKEFITDPIKFMKYISNKRK